MLQPDDEDFGPRDREQKDVVRREERAVGAGTPVVERHRLSDPAPDRRRSPTASSRRSGVEAHRRELEFEHAARHSVAVGIHRLMVGGRENGRSIDMNRDPCAPGRGPSKNSQAIVLSAPGTILPGTFLPSGVGA